MVNAAYVIVALPLLGFALNLVFGRRLGEPLAGWVGTFAAAGSFVASLITWVAMLGKPAGMRVASLNIFTWVPVAGLHVNTGLLVDPLSLTMVLFVTGVSSVIHLYSIGYMHRDPGFDRFFVYLNLFLFSMLVLVLANNFLFSFLGWEGVGFCSYGLIGFWFQREVAAVAAKKAFITNRVGDVGFLIAIFLIFDHFGSLNYSSVLGTLVGGHPTGLMAGAAGAIPGSTATAITLLLFLGAIGKSAQIPLYIWLVDAMEGPTPISALIHAATMVTAGVYLMSRVAPLLHYAHATSWVIASVGTGSAFLAATIAATQDDIKKCLAYSTISQLGYMFMAVGAGDYADGLYHMLTHAFFKALLFLGAGAIIHALADNQDMKKMGGLARYMPLTTVTFGVGWLAISGIVPFAGFWSKDAVLDSVWQMNKVLWGIGAFTAGLTAYYMSRQVGLVFTGQARWREASPALAGAGGASGHAVGGPEARAHGPEAHGRGEHEATEPGLPAPPHGGEPKDATWTMSLPLVLLAIASVLGGGINFTAFGHFDFLNRFLSPIFPYATPITLSTATKWTLSLVVLAFCLLGLGFGLRTWRTAEHPALEPVFLRRAWYWDATVAATVSGPLRAAAAALAFVMDSRLVDGFVNGVGTVLGLSGRVVRRVQTGYLRTYAIGIGAGLIAFLAYVTFRVGS
ncbi:MAG: NADH-quinone oxidoreductase subunit L [Actinomycetota bacterium]|jgi:NADH-quinone oxidoreductase subunit L|nr:NADH-quinone oxidoreductase subunit L [Actinomycetota bacterium]